MSEAEGIVVRGLSESLERLLQSHLEAHPEVREALAPLSGKVILIRIEPPGRNLYLCPTDRNIQILTEISGTADVTFKGAPSAFLRASLGPLDDHSARRSGIRIEGDLKLARAVQKTALALEIDWQRFLSRYLGHRLAGETLGLLGQGRQWMKESLRTLEGDLGDYLREETRWLLDRTEVSPFLSGVDTLRSDQDRLEKRIERLEKRLTQPGDTV